MKVRLATVGLMLLMACADAPVQSSEPTLEVPDAVEIDDLPQTREAFLAELAPLPEGPVSVTYQVSGPGGMTGTLTVLAAEGARRHEQWSLLLPMAGAEPVRIEGASIQTPDLLWTDAVEGSAALQALPLGRLADAYFDLEPQTRASVTKHVRGWHDEVSRGSAAHPGAVDAVLGQACLRTRNAGQSLCVWETTGLPLEYRSEVFVMVATEIQRGVEAPADAFEVPAGGQQATGSNDAFDPAESLKRLADGDLAEVASLLQPSLRVLSGA
ncbi:MAG: hypothetical protein AAGA54_01295 [Myxococcota bacterium]